MNDDGAKYLQEFLENTQTLQVLKASQCKLEDPSSEIISAAIKKNKKMKLLEIDLSTNNIKSNGFKALFVGL